MRSKVDVTRSPVSSTSTAVSSAAALLTDPASLRHRSAMLGTMGSETRWEDQDLLGTTHSRSPHTSSCQEALPRPHPSCHERRRSPQICRIVAARSGRVSDRSSYYASSNQYVRRSLKTRHRPACRSRSDFGSCRTRSRFDNSAAHASRSAKRAFRRAALKRIACPQRARASWSGLRRLQSDFDDCNPGFRQRLELGRC